MAVNVPLTNSSSSVGTSIYNGPVPPQVSGSLSGSSLPTGTAVPHIATIATTFGRSAAPSLHPGMEPPHVSILTENILETLKECRAKVRAVRMCRSMSWSARRAYAMSIVDNYRVIIATIQSMIATATGPYNVYESPYPDKDHEHYELTSLRSHIDNWF